MNLSFIKLDINIMNDTKIKLIRKMPDGDSVLVLWIGLLCLGMKSGKPGVIEVGDGIPFSDEMLSIELDIPINTVRLGLKTFQEFKMIEVWNDGQTYITNFEKHQELVKIQASKEKSRESSRKYREQLKLSLGDDHVTVTGESRDDTEEEEDKKEDQDSPGGKPKRKKIEYDPDFVSFWLSYPKRNNQRLGKANAYVEWGNAIKRDGVTPEFLRSAIIFLAPAYEDKPQDAERWLKNRKYLDYEEHQDQNEQNPFNAENILAKIKSSPEESRRRNEERVNRLNESNNHGGYIGDVPY